MKFLLGVMICIWCLYVVISKMTPLETAENGFVIALLFAIYFIVI